MLQRGLRVRNQCVSSFRVCSLLLTEVSTAEWTSSTGTKVTTPLVVKMSEDRYEAEEIKALKLLHLWVSDGKDSRSDNWSIVMHRGKGSPIDDHPEVKDPATRKKALEHFLPSAVQVLKNVAEKGWLQA